MVPDSLLELKANGNTVAIHTSSISYKEPESVKMRNLYISRSGLLKSGILPNEILDSVMQQTGLQNINGKTYFFNNAGELQTDSFDDNGVLQ